MFITKLSVERFRAFENCSFVLGKKLTLIAGHNGTMKTTLLGLLSQGFSIPNKGHDMSSARTIDGANFRSQFSEKFKFGSNEKAGEHIWSLYINEDVFGRDVFTFKSINRNADQLRFWSAEGREKGDGYLTFPVHYLSLKRISPIGEEGKIVQVDELDEAEKLFLLNEQKEVFTSIDDDFISSSAKSSNKYIAAAHSLSHDINTISAGQDSLGRIFLAVLSFRRLMNEYPTAYHGGILLIDEIESTLHPMAQRRLIKRLLKYSRDYSLQIVCTTHSPSVIKGAFLERHSNADIKLVYIQKIKSLVKLHNDFSDSQFSRVIDELEGNIAKDKVDDNIIKIYSEDGVALQFIRSMINMRKYAIKYMECSIGAENYENLIKHKVEEFCSSVVILDGDKQRIAQRMKNVICLPGNVYPEKLFYLFLHDLPPDDLFWDNELGGYSKPKCFQDYPNLSSDANNENEYKKWYTEQKVYWGKGCSRLYRAWGKRNKEDMSAFLSRFEKAYEHVKQIKSIVTQ